MAVQDQTPLREYTANGVTTSFALGFDCEETNHLIVTIDDVEVLPTDWYLSGSNVVFWTAPGNGKLIKLQRNTPFNRLADYQSYNNSFRPPAINKEFDRIWWKLQELGVADWILGARIDALKNYVDRKDDELKAYLMEEIRKQGVALDQLDEYYNYLMQRLAQIAVDKGWDASFVVDGDKTQKQINDDLKKATDFYVTPQMFAPKGVDIGDGIVDAYPYIQSALDSGYPVKLPFPTVKYRVTQNIVFDGHSVEGMASAPELYGSANASKVIVEFDGVTGDAVQNINTLSTVKNIWFRQKDWSTELNGLFLKRYGYFTECMFTHFNGYGWYGYVDPATPSLNPFHSVFNKSQFLFNAKHGVAVFQGANHIIFKDCLSRWNGSHAYGAQPVTGSYDGLFVGYSDDFPASDNLTEPQGLTIISGDWSYNSRYGQNWERGFGSVVVGGYIEANKVADFRTYSSFGINVLNPWVVTEQLDQLESDVKSPASINLTTRPNNITLSGRYRGNGTKRSGSHSNGFNQLLPSFYTAGSGAKAWIYASDTGSIEFMADTNQNVNFQNSAAVNIKKFRLGNFTTPASNADNYIAAKDTVEGSVFYYMVNAGAYGAFRVANGGGANAADAFMSAPKNSVTSRSINAGGTINASGADYAEYMYKSDGCCEIAKGEIVGVNSEGKLTKVYDESVSFVVKSTDPSIVGGDVWFTDVLPDAAADEDKADFDERMELARQKVDRIAFCGQVPISYVAEVGDYIIPIRNGDGTIGIETTKTPTFEQHLKCVGKVWKIVDSTPHIVVFNN